jgi:hypothetical protein
MPISKLSDLKWKVTLWQQQATPDGYGGNTLTETAILTTWAARELVKDGSRVVINAGLSSLNQDAVFYIRERAGFAPAKDMSLSEGGNKYTIIGILPEEEGFIRIYCKRQ